MTRVQTRNMSAKIDLMPAETWPLIVAISGACGLCVWYMGRTTMNHPDIRWGKTARLTKQSDDEMLRLGQRFQSHHGEWTPGGFMFGHSYFPNKVLLLKEQDSMEDKTIFN